MPGPTVAGAPPPSRDVFRRGFALLWRGIREEPHVFGISAAGSALYGVMTVSSAYVFGRVTQHVIVPALRSGHTTTGALVAAALAIVGVAVLKAIGIVLRRYNAGRMQYRLQAAYRRRVTRQYLRLPLSWHQAHPTGQLLSNANADVEATWFPIAPMPFGLGVVLMLFITIGLLLATDWLLAIVGLTVFPALAVLNFLYNRRLSPLATKAQQLRAEVSEVAHESFDGALLVKTLGREPEETARFREKAEALRDSVIAVGRLQGLFDPVLEGLPVLGVLAVLLVGTWRIKQGAIDVGGVVEVAYLFTILTLPVRAIGWVLFELPPGVVGWDRVNRVLQATGALDYGAGALDGGGPARLTLQEVDYSYGDAPVVREVSFDVEPGRTVAIVGPTGSGKSTLTTLLVRLVDPATGQVLLDGVDLRDVQVGGVSGVASLVPQQTFLFDDTVRDNVTLGLDVDDDEVWAALELAQADGFIRALPHGLDTQIGERGTTLSGGQRQRLALARALVRKPRLLILDDATSSVDPRVEAAILNGLRATQLPATVIVIAYRRATIALADEVVYVEHGRVVARGTHGELLANVPGYRALITAYEQADQERLAARELAAK